MGDHGRLLVIEHELDAPAGLLGPWARARGLALSTVHLGGGDRLPARLPEVAGLVVLGSERTAFDDAVPWLAGELDLVRQALADGVPVLGICFGAQMLAAASGGTVEDAGRPEIGWVTVDTADPELIPAGPWLEFHHDRCLPPAHAAVLARNDLGVQAYRLGRHLAVQFHPEVDGDQFRLWLNAGGRTEIEAAGLDPDRLLAQTIAEEPEAAARAGQLVASALRIAAEARAG